ncbi:unnamed protein product, partial [Nesidiocoris tenuis]
MQIFLSLGSRISDVCLKKLFAIRSVNRHVARTFFIPRTFVLIIAGFVFQEPPQVMRGAGGAEVIALRGSDAVLALVVCADPRPHAASWEWGSLHLQVGQGLGRYRAEQLVQ